MLQTLLSLCLKMHPRKQIQLVWSGINRTSLEHFYTTVTQTHDKNNGHGMNTWSMLNKLKRDDMYVLYRKQMFSKTVYAVRESIELIKKHNTVDKWKAIRQHVACPLYCPKLISLVLHVLHAMHDASFAFRTRKRVSPQRSWQVNFDFYISCCTRYKVNTTKTKTK